MTKADAINSVKEDSNNFYKIDGIYRHDPDVILEVLKTESDNDEKHNYLSYLNDDITNKNMALKLCTYSGYALEHITPSLRNDKDVVHTALKHTDKSDALEVYSKYIGQEVKDDPDIVLEGVRSNVDILGLASDRVKRNREIVIDAVKIDGTALIYVDPTFRSDRKVAMEALKTSGNVLEILSDDLKNDIGIVKEAVRQDGTSIQYASEELKSDPEIVLESIKNNRNAAIFIGDDIREHKDVNDELNKLILNSSSMENNPDQKLDEDELKELEEVLNPLIEEKNKKSEELKKDVDSKIEVFIGNKSKNDTVERVKNKLEEEKNLTKSNEEKEKKRSKLKVFLNSRKKSKGDK